MAEPKLLPSEGERLTQRLLSEAPKSKKKRVTITLTPERVFITDMLYRVGDGR